MLSVSPVQLRVGERQAVPEERAPHQLRAHQGEGRSRGERGDPGERTEEGGEQGLRHGGLHLPRAGEPCSILPGRSPAPRGPPSPGARSLTPEKTLARFKKLCENPNGQNLKIAKLGQIRQLKGVDSLLYQVLQGFSK